MPRLIFDFPDFETREDFIGWYLDGNGEQDFDSCQEMHDKARVSSKPPEGQKKWDWNINPKAEDVTIRLVPDAD